MLLLLATLLACAPVHTARLSPDAAPTAREAEAADRARARLCGNTVGVLIPGAAQVCWRRPVDGAVVFGATAAQAAAGVALLDVDAIAAGEGLLGGRQVPWIGVQDAVAIGLGAAALDLQLAQWRPYTPQDTLGELVAAPFNGRVLRRPAVWGGTLALLAGGIGLSLALSPPTVDPSPPQLFGWTPHPAIGWPAFAALDATLFTQVALAEEIEFRGLIQSGLARSLDDEIAAWLIASAVFGAVHAFNAVALPPDQRAAYLAVGLPWITLAGLWMGHTYRAGDYSLTGPVAIHFWYDALLTATFAAIDPAENPFALTVRGRF